MITHLTPALCAKGGRRRTKAKLAALAALHASRRGVRLNGAGYTERDLRIVLGDVAAALREPERGVRSIRVLAAHLRVSDKTVRRWLSGRCWPPVAAVRAMRDWVREVK